MEDSDGFQTHRYFFDTIIRFNRFKELKFIRLAIYQENLYNRLIVF